MSKNAPFEMLPWDSEFFGLRVARLTNRSLTPDILKNARDWSETNAIDCMYFLSSAGDSSSTRLAETLGFHLMDVRMTLTREVASRDASVANASEITIRGVRTSDVTKLEGMSASIYGDSRFYADPNFCNEKCAELYRTWIRRSCDGYAEAVLIAEKHGEPIGYITLDITPDKTSTSISLLGVAAESRRHGAGTLLLEHAIAWSAKQGARTISVVTQIRNVNAIRRYERVGFCTSGVDLWYHWWPKKDATQHI